MDCIVHGVTKNWTRLSDFHSLTVSCLQYLGRGDEHNQTVKHTTQRLLCWSSGWTLPSNAGGSILG